MLTTCHIHKGGTMGQLLERYIQSLLVICASIVLFAPSDTIGQVQSGSDADRSVYDNDEIFQQLSSAKQTLLELKFGKKHSLAGKESQPSFGGQFSPIISGGERLSSLVQTLVNNPAADATAQDTQSETAIVLGSGSNVIAGFNDSGSYLGGASHFTGWSTSTDGGTTWIDGGTLPTSVDGDAGDPVLARSAATGTVFLATLSFNNANDLELFRSTNNGFTWLAPINSAPGFTSTTGSHDKEWIAVDNFPGTGFGNLYQFWRNFGAGGGMTFTRSTNDGVTWIPSGGTLLDPSPSGQGACVVVGTDHSVYCFWYSSASGIVVRKSIDFGLTFSGGSTVTTLLSTGVNGDLGLGFRSNTFPHAAVNPVNGNIYLVYDDKASAPDRAEVYFRQSTNGGATWSSAVRVNDDVGTNDNWEPALAVTPDGTTLSIAWYDRRIDPANTLIARWGVVGTISGSTVTFGLNFPISDQFPPVYGVDPVVTTAYMGDYDQMTADNSFFYTTWGDNRDQSIAVPARKNANVRFAKIPKAGVPPAPLLSFASDALIPGTGNGNASVDPNECNNFNIAVKNNGSATATGVSGTITTSTAGVTVTSSTSVYANIAPSATITNTTPFQIQTSPSFVCGTPVVLTLTLTYTGGSNVVSPTPLPSVGPGYAITSTTGASIVPGTADIGNHGDDVVTPIALPFTYQFYGANFTTANVCSNGHLQFTSSSNAITNACLPDTAMTDVIYPHWDDQRTDVTYAGKGIFTSTSGVAPNRIFNIEWRTVYYINNAQNANFEVRLYEGQRKFDVIYGTMDQAGANATVGCQQGTGAAFSQYECNAGGLSSGLQLTFTYATCVDAGGAGCTPLPIQLASFTGSTVNGNQIRLDWTTLSEVNNYGFEVQKSVQAAGDFTTIPGSFIQGHGTTNDPHSYSYIDVAPGANTLYYRLKQIDLDGSFTYNEPIRVDVVTSVAEGGIPTSFSLSQNYPNPFNPSTVIKYGLPTSSEVKLEVFNMLGQRVAVLVDAKQEAGFHQAVFENAGLSSGVYLYTIQAGQFRASRKFLLLR